MAKPDCARARESVAVDGMGPNLRRFCKQEQGRIEANASEKFSLQNRGKKVFAFYCCLSSPWLVGKFFQFLWKTFPVSTRKKLAAARDLNSGCRPQRPGWIRKISHGIRKSGSTKHGISNSGDVRWIHFFAIKKETPKKA